MKKILLLAFLWINMLPTYSQTSIGIIGGYNRARQYYQRPSPGPYGKLDVSSATLLRAGLIADHRLWKKLYLQPQLLLNTKGEDTKYSSTYTPELFYTYQTSLRLLYLELQANLIFKQQLWKGYIFLGGGPYIGRGIRGLFSSKGYTVLDNQKTDFDSTMHVTFARKQGNDLKTYYRRPYDAGINLQAGYELKNGLFISAVSSLGLTDLGYMGLKTINIYSGLSVGYFFKKFN